MDSVVWKPEDLYMRIRSFLIQIVLLFSALLCCFEVDAQDKSHLIIVDDFEKPGKKNVLNGDFGAFSDPDKLGRCYLFFFDNKEKVVHADNRYSLYIQWDTSKKGAYGGYWTKVNHLNVKDFNNLSFYVKGTKGGEIFKVGVRGGLDSVYENKILINKVLKKGVSTEWQKVKIPLLLFTAIDDWSDVNVISINFEHDFGSSKGSVLIDELAFEK